MRHLLRPFVFFTLLCGFTAVSQSSTPPAGGGFNVINWAKASPNPTTGGVDVEILIKPTLNWTCTEVVFKVIEKDTGKTLDTSTDSMPGMTSANSFAGLNSNVAIRVTANATFAHNNGKELDFKDIEAFTTTK